jgi:hypothetical protein
MGKINYLRTYFPAKKTRKEKIFNHFEENIVTFFLARFPHALELYLQ